MAELLTQIIKWTISKIRGSYSKNDVETKEVITSLKACPWMEFSEQYLKVQKRNSSVVM